MSRFTGERYLLDPLSADQLAALRSSVVRDIIDTQQQIAEASKRLAAARATNDVTCTEMAESCLREGHARILALESVKPILFMARTELERRITRSTAHLTRRVRK